MADPKIRLKRSSVEGKIPTPDQVPLGEIALNTYDGYLYASKNVGIGTTVIAINPFRVGTGTNTYNAYFTAGNVGIGSEIPTTKLDVDGTVTATSFAGSGANLTGLTGASAATYGSTGVTPVITVDANGRITGISTVTTSGSGGGLAQVSDDTTPQLGGTLDTNGNLIQFGDSGIATDDRLQFGASQDLQIYHDGSHNYIETIVSDANLRIKQAGAGGVELYANAPKILFNDITGGTQIDFSIADDNGSFTITDETNSDTVLNYTQNAALELYYNNSKKFETTNDGIVITGIATATGFSTSGGTSSQFLKADGSVDSSTYLSSVVEDITPQLGGNLDLNSNNITGTGNVNVTGIITSSSLSSDKEVKIGVSQDLLVQHSKTKNQLSKIVASVGSTSQFFGNSVAIGTSKFVVGSNGDDLSGNDFGSAYIYDLDGNNEVKITASDGANNDRFGNSVGIAGTIIVVGAQASSDIGQAYIFDLSGNQLGIITASDGAATDGFGFSVGVGTSKIVVGAYGDDDNGSDSGSAYIYDLDGTNEVKITASDGAANDNFGRSVGIGGTIIVVGAYSNDNIATNAGQAYIFDLDGNQLGIITASDGASFDNFGYSVGVSSDKIVVGAWGHDSNGTVRSGAAYIYDIDGNNEVKITVSDGAANDYFGWSVDVSGDKVVVGAKNNDINGSNSGAAYIFNVSGKELGKFTAQDGASNDNFGNSVSIESNQVLIGSSQDDVGSNANQGSAYLFDASGKSYIENKTGDLIIESIDTDGGSGANVIINAGTGKTSIVANANGSVELWNNGSKKLETISTGATITGDLYATTLYANITESSVTQHQAALSITESQISDLQSYLTSYTETQTLDDVLGLGNTSSAGLSVGVVTATSFVKSSNSGGFLKADGTEDTNTYLTSYTETDPVVAAINGIVKSDGTTISAATAGTDYLTDISQDTTPQLGGNLDLNSNDITGTGNLNITGIATFSGNVTIGGTLTYEDVTNIDSVGLVTARSGIVVNAGGVNVTGVSTFQDDIHLLFGDKIKFYGSPSTQLNLEIYDSNASAYILKRAGTDLVLLNDVNDYDVVIETDNGSGSHTPYYRADGSTGESILYHYGSQKLATKSNGIDVTGHTETDTLNVSGISTFQDDVEVTGNIEKYDTLVGSASTTTVDFTVTVAAKSDHRYSGGSSNAYYLNGIESPFLTLTPGRTYNFKQDDSSNLGHPFRFYLEADKTTQYTEGVTSVGTPGNANSMTSIEVTDETPVVLHYQCSAHDYMGNAVQANSNKVNTPYQIDGLKGANITGVVTATSLVKSGGTSSQFLKADGSVDSSTYLTSYTETDPVVAAINGIVKSNGTTISAATAGTDYLTPSGDGSSLTGLTGASAATYGSAGATPVIVVDSNGRITGISTVATSGGGGGGGISNVSEDTTPQLGGTLDTNGNLIQFGDSGSATDDRLQFGASQDLQIYHNGTANVIHSTVSGANLQLRQTGTGSVVVYGDSPRLDFNDVTGGTQIDFRLQANNGNFVISDISNSDNVFKYEQNAGVKLFWNGTTTLETTGSGIDVTGIVTATSFSGSGSNLTGLTGASAATYGSSTVTPVITVDANGRITTISTATISGGGGGSSSTRTVNRYVATQSQTLFPASGTISYSVGYLDVYLNGSRLDTTEFTATNGTTVTLGTGASANDIVELVAFTNVNLTDVTVVNDTSPQLGGDLDLNSNNITGTGNINITGTATVSGSQVATQNDAIAFAIALG